MKFTFKDTNAVYSSTHDGKVQAQVNGDREPTIFAAGFVLAKQAVEDRLRRERAKQIDAAWAMH